jgi:hypothetical protein
MSGWAIGGIFCMRYRLSALLVVLIVGLVLPIAYALSTGPLHWLYMHGYIDHESSVHRALDALYWPLDLLVSRSELLTEVMRWWLGLWRTGLPECPN